MPSPYSPDERCWWCWQQFNKPHLAHFLEGPAAHYRRLGFCSLDCILAHITEQKAQTSRAKVKQYPEVVLQDGKLAIIPAKNSGGCSDSPPHPQHEAAAKAQAPAFSPGADGAASVRAPPSHANKKTVQRLPEALP